jgi:hypothetical protein
MGEEAQEELTQDKIQVILLTALHKMVDNFAKGRQNHCNSIGLVHSIVDEKGNVETYLIEFSDKGWRVNKIETDLYPDGTFLYFHDDEAETVTQAALFGDRVVEDLL